MQLDQKLKHYHDVLLKWQKTINLVSPSTLQNVENRHFNDSLQLLNYIPDTAKNMCDIGSGAGFPGLVIAIKRPEINVTLVESDARKCAFLQTVSRETNCTNVTIINDRIENCINDISADCLTSRALASLRQLIFYAQPLWCHNKDFQMILPKGANYEDEIKEAKKSYKFEYDDFSSVTDDKARIIIVYNIHPL